MTYLDQNLFALQFFSIGDKEYVLEEGPWAFDSHIMLLKELDPNMLPSKIEFTIAHFWIKIYDLPMSWRNHKFAEHIGNKIGAFVDVDQSDLLIPSKALKIRINYDLHKALRRGLMLKVNGESTWFKMKYHKLPDFYYTCGMLGRIYRRCEHYDTNIPKSELQYGSWTRASPIKKKAKELKKEILQEGQKLLRLQDPNTGAKAKMKLKFTKGSPSAMNINHVLIPVSGEMVKRKKDALFDFTPQESKLRAMEKVQDKICPDEPTAEVAS